MTLFGSVQKLSELMLKAFGVNIKHPSMRYISVGPIIKPRIK